MLASFVQKCTFCPSSIQRGEESARTIIGSFWGAYREQKGTGEDVELERMVVSHIGAHMAWRKFLVSKTENQRSGGEGSRYAGPG